MTTMIIRVMSIVLTVLTMKLVVCKIEVTIKGMFRNIVVGVFVVDCMMIALPVIGSVLDAVHVVMVVHLLGVMFTLILVRVVVSHVVRAFWLNVMVLSMLFTSEMAFVTQVRLMITQVPVTLFEVSRRVMLLTMHHYYLSVHVLRVRVLIRCTLSA